MNPTAAPGLWARFSARFDDVLLTPPVDAGGPAGPAALADELTLALAALCKPGASFAMARHTLAAAPEQRAFQKARLQRQMLELDGTLDMQQLGGPWRQRLHRVAIKLRESAAAGSTADGPWDCGFVNGGAGAAARAASFVPRRPTLMVSWQMPAGELRPLQAALQARQAGFALPVRLWVLEQASVP
jgi:hypothetical protein